MKIVDEKILVSRGPFARSAEWRVVHRKLRKAVRAVGWPPGSGKFTIYPESGKKRGMGNGVKPIKAGLMLDLEKQGWSIEGPARLGGAHNFGNFDALYQSSFGPVVVEWETGNISSSHRSLNKMSLALMRGKIAAGILIVPSRELYRFLTDRVGNITELEPYLDIWRSVRCKEGILQIVVVQHDATSLKVPRITKMTDGRALA